MKKIICVLLILCCFVPLVSCSKFDEDYVYDGHSLIGKWMEKDYDEEYYISYEFFEDGRIETVDYSYGIQIDSSVGTYTVDKNVLVARFVDNYSGSVQYVENRFSMKDDLLVMLYLDSSNQMEEKEMILVPFDVDFNEGDEELYGTWQDKNNPNEIWTFNDDFTGTASIKDYEITYHLRYSVNGKKIYISYEPIEGVFEGIVEMKYKIKDDTLTIKGEYPSGEVMELVLERN